MWYPLVSKTKLVIKYYPKEIAKHIGSICYKWLYGEIKKIAWHAFISVYCFQKILQLKMLAHFKFGPRR